MENNIAALATYTEGKENGIKETVEVASKVAAELIKIVQKVEPDKVKFYGPE